MLAFRVARINENAIIPKRSTSGAAGYDLFASEDTIVPLRTWMAVPTAIAIHVPSDHYARIAPRSGLALKNGIDVGAGVVDSCYQGEIKVILFNHSGEHFKICRGDRIAQMIFEKISTPDLEEISVEELRSVPTDRGVGGFGSTGL